MTHNMHIVSFREIARGFQSGYTNVLLLPESMDILIVLVLHFGQLLISLGVFLKLEYVSLINL